MRKAAILIAVEQYGDNRISPVKYARADAQDLGLALEEHGFAAADQTVLIDNAATKTLIESRVRKVLDGLTEDDTLYFCYAGHGFAKDGKNYITCSDTDIDDLENTSIPVQWLFDRFWDSSCNKLVMFLDSCESGMLATSKVRGIYTDLTEDELNAFFGTAEHCVCFAACKPGQKSHSSDHLKHGIWTHHLVQALSADDPGALEKGHLLTSASLQNHLFREVPKTIRATFKGNVVQTPWVYGAMSSDFLVGDVGPILERRKLAANPHLQQLRQIVLLSERAVAIKRLSGFSKKRGHFVPDEASSSADDFVGRIAETELHEDLEQQYGALRTAFGFKRRDLQTDGPEDGSGSIITPHFDYEVSVRVNPDDATEALWRREITNIREPDQVLSEEFDAAFPSTFDRLEFQVAESIDIEGIVDQIENLDDDRVSVECNRECTHCRVRIEGLDASIIITPGSFQLERFGTGSPRKLLEGFFEAQKLLIDQHQIKQLPFSGPHV